MAVRGEIQLRWRQSRNALPQSRIRISLPTHEARYLRHLRRHSGHVMVGADRLKVLPRSAPQAVNTRAAPTIGTGAAPRQATRLSITRGRQCPEPNRNLLPGRPTDRPAATHNLYVRVFSLALGCRDQGSFIIRTVDLRRGDGRVIPVEKENCVLCHRALPRGQLPHVSQTMWSAYGRKAHPASNCLDFSPI